MRSRWCLTIAALIVLLPLSACIGSATRSTPAVSPLSTGAVTPSTTDTPLKLLKTSPEKGTVGTTVTLTGQGLSPGKSLDIVWVTVDGSYKTGESKNGGALAIEFNGRTFTPKRLTVGHAAVDGDGAITANFSVPEDYGELHDIYLAADGRNVAKGGFRLLRSFTLSPTEGPVGTVITVKGTALGWQPFESTASLRYDNKYTGFISGTTTRGSATFQFRAAGPVGKHYISIDAASAAEPFLNITTGGGSTRHLLPYEAAFTVTDDKGPPPDSMDWPDSARIAAIGSLSRIPSMGQPVSTPGVTASLLPISGVVLTKVDVEVSGLSAGDADLVWVAARRNDNFMSGTDAEGPLLGSVTVGRNGAVTTTVTVPEDVGGWHLLAVIQKGKIMLETPFYVEQSLASPLPVQVKAGDKFTLAFRGGGWTELDNGAAVTYDNAYVGFVCGYANNGDTPVQLTATGGPGTHLIDIYPYIYGGGHGDWPWQYNLPHLTSLQDHPGLALGYRLPIYRLAINVVP